MQIRRRFALVATGVVAGLATAAACASAGGTPGVSGDASGSTRATTVADAPAVVTTIAASSTSVASSETSSVTSTPRIGPLTPRDQNRISAADRAAIEALGASSAGEPHSGHGHTHGETPNFMPLFNDTAEFAYQWLQAQRSTSRFDTLDEIRALGYVRSSAPIAGIGSHWVLWPQISQPFDPAWPSMVLFDESVDPAVLVGYSYWLQSATEPEGFAGPNDEWHQHQGLCVVNGWVDRERSPSPAACGGTWFPGGDLWMLHAWPVAGYESADGVFATFNRRLCPANVGTPDIARCPD